MAEDRTFVFRRLDRVGAAAAEDDTQFLSDCFVDTGLLDALRDVVDSRSIVVGRTGSGKTALLMELEKHEERAIRIEPESLALPYVSNSTILGFVEGLGVKLDVFFRLLWRHVFTVEIIRTHFALTSEEEAKSFFQKLSDLFGGKDSRNSRALAYLKQWGAHFGRRRTIE